MPDVGEIIIDNAKVGVGATIGAGMYTFIDGVRQNLPVVKDIPEATGAAVGGIGLAIRLLGIVPEGANRVGDGITAAGLIGVVDKGMNRLSGKDIISYN